MSRSIATLLGVTASVIAFGSLSAQGVDRTPSSRRVPTTLSLNDRAEARRRLLSLIRDTDPASSGALYEAQQEGMTLAAAVFEFGSAIDQDTVLRTAAAKVDALPTAETLFNVGVFVDNLPVPAGIARARRIFPMFDGTRVNTLSEVELQYCYLLSTILRLASENPLSPGSPLASQREAAVSSIFRFLLRDKVGFYWSEMPAWHWTGPYLNMRERLLDKLADTSARVRSPAWFGAMVDHELHLLGVAADLTTAARLDPALRASMDVGDGALLGEIQAVGLRVLQTRVTRGPSNGFLIDFGRWSDNVSYQYAGCSDDLQPLNPCSVDFVATDVSHARRWPWWLQSMEASWTPDAPQRAEISAYSRRLARQFATQVLAHDPVGRPLTRNYMDGRDGWYSLRDAPGKLWGYGPSTMSGSLRYESWAILGQYEPDIRAAYTTFCRVITSSDPGDVAFRVSYYGSPSSNPALGGRGEVDLYSPSSFYALLCRLTSALAP